MVNLGKLCRPYAGGDARGVHQIGALIPGGAVVTVGDPDGGTVREAGCLGENHGSGRLICGYPRRSGGIACPLCARSATVPILPDDHAILANLGVPVFFREGEAQIPGAVLIGGFILPGGRGADHGKAVHQVGFVWFLIILQHRRGHRSPPL